MKFMKNGFFFSKDSKMLNKIDSAALDLANKLRNLNVAKLGISEYNKVFLQNNYICNINAALQKISHIIACITSNNNIPLEKLVLIDYGGGTGVISLLAKQLGIGTVIYNDIYDISCQDARAIADSLELPADFYICGEIDSIIKFLKEKSISCDSFVSNDVIEHIYDIEGFLKKLGELPGNQIRIALATGANPFNPLIRRKWMKLQIKLENEDRAKKIGHKERDSLKSYSGIRREVISNHSKLSESEVELLVKLTRGMIVPDILGVLERYLSTGEVPQEPNHPTNTCDPITGNWAEHLMDVYALKDTLSDVGYKTKILNGYYGIHRKLSKRIVGNISNPAIYILGNQGIRIAPYYIIYGQRIQTK